jgi:hypothetical protein
MVGKDCLRIGISGMKLGGDFFAGQRGGRADGYGRLRVSPGAGISAIFSFSMFLAGNLQ